MFLYRLQLNSKPIITIQHIRIPITGLIDFILSLLKVKGWRERTKWERYTPLKKMETELALSHFKMDLVFQKNEACGHLFRYSLYTGRCSKLNGHTFRYFPIPALIFTFFRRLAEHMSESL